MKNGNKVLVISYVPTHPQDAGNKSRVYANIEALRELGFDVDFLYYRSGLNDDLVKMKEYIGRNHFYMIPQYNRPQSIRDIVRDALSKTELNRYISIKYKIDDWYPEKISSKVAQLCRNNQYYAVIVEYVMYSKALNYVNESAIKIIDTHDRFSDRDRLFLNSKLKPSYFYTSKKEERKGFGRADAILAIQSNETRYFKWLIGGGKAKVYTFGHILDFVNLPEPDEESIGIIASDNLINVEGVKWFIDKVFPEIRKKKNNVKLVIAGNICNKLDDSDKYIKLGRVDKPEDFYKEIRVAINPVSMGTGLNIKSIESISYGRTLISTSVGIKGIKYKKKIYYEANSIEEIRDAVLETLLSKESRISIRDNCKEYIEYYNRKIKKSLKNVLKI